MSQAIIQYQIPELGTPADYKKLEIQIPALVIKAFEHIKSLFPYVTKVHYGEGMWLYHSDDGKAPAFMTAVDVDLIEQASEQVEGENVLFDFSGAEPLVYTAVKYKHYLLSVTQVNGDMENTTPSLIKLDADLDEKGIDKAVEEILLNWMSGAYIDEDDGHIWCQGTIIKQSDLKEVPEADWLVLNKYI